ncbi:MAG: DUF6624 domain-containing protein [Paraglaciecola sp.]|uniref:DUF6624 domain-containing protein n=1 Tax=Paraglaciecola sp. TaxID=1920173 RepID=UPI003298E85F
MKNNLSDWGLSKYLSCILCLLAFSQDVYGKIDSELQNRLVQMAKQSLEITQQNHSDNNEVLQQLQTDLLNLHSETLQAIVSLHGWPSESLVGTKGVTAAFIIVKHSQDLLFQQNMLPLIIQSYLNGQGITGQSVAIITDLVAIKQEKPQIFGTQYDVINGKVIFKPIANIGTIDSLRAELSLVPFAEFKQQLESKHKDN